MYLCKVSHADVHEPDFVLKMWTYELGKVFLEGVTHVLFLAFGNLANYQS